MAELIAAWDQHSIT